MFKPHLIQAHEYWERLLSPMDIVIDATCGNGKDTRVLSQLVPQGHVYTIDIQASALIKAQSYISSKNVTYLLQCHTLIPDIRSIKLIVYNLGYLPGGNKHLTTQTNTTLLSLEKASQVLDLGGALSIMCYPGHPNGKEETLAVKNWCYRLNPQYWKLYFHEWTSCTPVLYYLIKLKF